MQVVGTTALLRGNNIVVVERALNNDGSQLLRPIAEADFVGFRRLLAGAKIAERGTRQVRQVVVETSVEPLPNPFIKRGPVRVLEPTYTGDLVRGCVREQRFRRITEATHLENIEAWSGFRRPYRSWKERRPNKFKRNSIPF